MLARWNVRLLGHDDAGKELLRECEVIHISAVEAAAYLQVQTSWQADQVWVKRQAEMLIPDQFSPDAVAEGVRRSGEIGVRPS